MSNPLVSVIIPTYNVERYIDDCIESVVNQTYDNLEIIVIDDASSDATPYLLKSFKDKIILSLNEKNKGQGAVRNQGLNKAKGEYVLFVDSDDWIESDTIEILVKTALQTEAEMVRFNGIPYFEGEADPFLEKQYNFSSVLEEKTFYADGGLLQANQKAYSASPCLYLIEREVIEEEQIRFPEGILHEDEVFTTKCFLSVKSMVYVNRAFYHRRYRIASTMTQITPSHKRKSFDSYMKVFELLEAEYKRSEYNEKQKSFLKRQLLSIYSGLQQSDVPPILKKKLRKFKIISLKDKMHIQASRMRQKLK